MITMDPRLSSIELIPNLSMHPRCRETLSCFPQSLCFDDSFVSIFRKSQELPYNEAPPDACWEQALYSDTLLSALAGRPVFYHCWNFRSQGVSHGKMQTYHLMSYMQTYHLIGHPVFGQAIDVYCCQMPL